MHVDALGMPELIGVARPINAKEQLKKPPQVHAYLAALFRHFCQRDT
jgi:hypothetical protein